MPVNDVFSKRGKPLPDVFQCDVLQKKLRTQIQLILRASLFPLDSRTDEWGARDYTITNSIRQAVCREHGIFFLHRETDTPVEDIDGCIANSQHVLLVLDVVELACRTLLGMERSRETAPAVIDELNHRFRENGVGYQFERSVGSIVPMTNLVVHQEVIRPTLLLLSDPKFKTANDEYLEAFDDFKKSDYDDCLTKCCSAFESVMKIVCEDKKWPYKQNDTARNLIDTHILKTGLDTFFTDPLMIVATLRNRLSRSHGQGTQPKQVSEHLARYALNATASAILLIVDAANACP